MVAGWLIDRIGRRGRMGRPCRLGQCFFEETDMPCLRSLVALLMLAAVAVAGDWPQWLGPNRDGTTTERVQPWKAALKIAWRQPVGEGHGSAVVADGRVYVNARVVGKDAEV